MTSIRRKNHKSGNYLGHITGQKVFIKFNIYILIHLLKSSLPIELVCKTSICILIHFKLVLPTHILYLAQSHVGWTHNIYIAKSFFKYDK